MKKLLYFICSISIGICCYLPAKSQVIVSLAGKTTEGYRGDSGLALNCNLHWPEAIALDAVWNMYVADANNNVIRMINSATGKITTIVGSGFEAGTGTGAFGGDGGPASAARLNYPSGVAVDATGKIYIADQKNHRVRMVDNTGNISTFAGTGVAGYTGDGAAANAAKLNFPTRVAVDAVGNVYIADATNNVIRKVDGSGTITTVAGTGTAGFAGDGAAAAMAQLNNPLDMTVDATGNLFIADLNNNRLRKVDPGGTITTYAGIGIPGFSGDGGQATNANIFLPSGIVADAAGNVYFSDRDNARIRKITPAGIISSFAGNGTSGYSGDNGPALAAQIFFPQGLAVNTMGGIYIADKANNRIRYASTTLGSEPVKQDAAALSVFPNPGSGAITVLLTSSFDEEMTITISNMTGQRITEVRATTNHPESLQLNVSPGVYLLSAVSMHGSVNEKVVVR